jgi:FecR protein
MLASQEMNMQKLRRWTQAATGLAIGLLLLAFGAAFAQGDPYGRVGRLADIQGNVWVYEHEQGDWSAALRNRPLTSGDRISTGPDARAELRIGSSTLRVAARSELELLQLDDQRVRIQLLSGSMAVRIRSRDVADDFELLTSEARFKPLRAGHFRIDRQDDTTFAASLRGEMLLDDTPAFPINTGTRMEFWREGSQRQLRNRWANLPQDELASWIARDEQQEQRSASSRYVSPEMTGSEDLDRYGRWESHPEHGALWVPISVQLGWAPYRYGSWVWLRPWGWTWVDAQPWGFAPFHYGRWVNWRGRWCWAPGAYAPRPVFAPALVNWAGPPPPHHHPGVSVGVVIGSPGRPLPGAHWTPLAPHEAYVPHHVPPQPWGREPHRGHDRDHDPNRPRMPHDPPGRALPPAPWTNTPAVPAGPPTMHVPKPVRPPTPQPAQPLAPTPSPGSTIAPAAPPVPQTTAPLPPPPRHGMPVFGAPAPAAPAAPAIPSAQPSPQAPQGPHAVPPSVPAVGPGAPPVGPPKPRFDRHPREHEGAKPAARDEPRAQAPEQRQGGRDREREHFR